MKKGSINQNQCPQNKQPALKKKIKLKSILFFERKQQEHKSTKSSDGKKSNDDHSEIVTVYVMGNQKLFSYFANNKIDIPREFQQVCKSQGISFKKINVPSENGQAELRILNIQKLNALPDAINSALRIQSENKICIIAYNIASQSTAMINQCAQLWKSSQSSDKHQSCLMIVGINHGCGVAKMKTKKVMELARKYGAIFMETEQNQCKTIIQKIELVIKSLSSTQSRLHSKLKNIVIQVSTLKSKLHFLKFSPVSQIYQIWNFKIDTIIQIIKQIFQMFFQLTGLIEKIAQEKWSYSHMQKMKNKLQEYHRLKKFMTDLSIKTQNIVPQEDQNISNFLPNQINKRKIQKIEQLIASATQQISKTQSLISSATNTEQNYKQLIEKLQQKIKQLDEQFKIIKQLKQKLQQSSNFKQNLINGEENINNSKVDQKQKQFLNKFIIKMVLQSKSIIEFIEKIKYNKQISAQMHEKIKENEKQKIISINGQQGMMSTLVKYFLSHKQKQLQNRQNKQQENRQLNKQQIKQFKQEILNSIQQIRKVISQYDAKKSQEKDYNQDSLRERLQIQQHTYKIIMDNYSLFSKIHDNPDQEYRTPKMNKKESQSNIK